jgi:hypothetical protein
MQPQVAGSCALDAPYRPLAVPRTAVAIRLPKLWLAQCRCVASLARARVRGAGGPGPSRGRCCSGSGCKGATTCDPLRLVAASSRDLPDCSPLRPRARRGRVLGSRMRKRPSVVFLRNPRLRKSGAKYRPCPCNKPVSSVSIASAVRESTTRWAASARGRTRGPPPTRWGASLRAWSQGPGQPARAHLRGSRGAATPRALGKWCGRGSWGRG